MEERHESLQGEEGLQSETNLKPGDILIEITEGGLGIHAGIWAPLEMSVRPFAHAVYSENAKKLSKTCLPPGDYVVCRLQDGELAELVAQIANQWCRYETPYSEKRLTIGTEYYMKMWKQAEKDDELATQKMFEAAAKHFSTLGKCDL